MESEPVERDEDSIKTLQVRSLLGKDRMKMVSERVNCHSTVPALHVFVCLCVCVFVWRHK